MAPSNIVRSNALVNLSGERVVVVGGTQGIGAGVAKRFAKAGAEVWIVGRNEKLGNEVVEEMRKAATEKSETSKTPGFHFFQADLSRKAGMKRIADEIKDRAGAEGIDYLILSQGGPSNGDATANPDGFDDHVGVTVLSRFALAYYLSYESNVVKKSVVSILGPGHGSKSFDVDDILLEKVKAQKKYGFISSATRNSTISDAVTLYLSAARPTVQYTHLGPGVVKTDVMANSNQGFLLATAFKLACVLVGQSAADYAEIPFYLTANPEGREQVAKESLFWDEKPKRVEASPAAKVDETRTKIWEKLVALIQV